MAPHPRQLARMAEILPLIVPSLALRVGGLSRAVYLRVNKLRIETDR